MIKVSANCIKVFARAKIVYLRLFVVGASLALGNIFSFSCLAMSPEDTNELLQLGRIADLNQRLKRLDTYLTSHPNSVRLIGYRAEVNNILGYTDATIRDANKYFQLNKEPIVAQICKVRAHAYLKKGINEKAVADLNLAKKIDGNDGETAMLLGRALEQVDCDRDALAEYDRAIALKFQRAYSCRAKLNLRLNRPKAAVADSLLDLKASKNYILQDQMLYYLNTQNKLDEMVVVCDGLIQARVAQPVVYSSKATALWQLKRYDQALKACDQSLANCGDPLDMQRYLIYKEQKQTDKALALLANMMKAKPQDLSLYLKRADLYLVSKQYDLALADFSRASALVAKDIKAQRKRAECYFRLGKYTEAKQEFAALRKTSNDQDAVETLMYEALTYMSLKKYSEAAQIFSKALKLKPLSSTLLNYRGDCYFRLGDYKKADADLSDAIVLSPKIYFYYVVRGSFRCEAGNYVAAIADYTTALNDPGLLGAASAGRAKAYRKLGRVAEAEKDERAVASANKSLDIDLFKQSE